MTRMRMLALAAMGIGAGVVSLLRLSSASACSCADVGEEWDVEIEAVTVDGEPTTPAAEYRNAVVSVKAGFGSSDHPSFRAFLRDGGTQSDLAISFQPR